jgi:hypothetical protein
VKVEVRMIVSQKARGSEAQSDLSASNVVLIVTKSLIRWESGF